MVLRANSATPGSRQKIHDQISAQTEKLNITRCRTRSPSITPAASRRWSSIMTQDTIHEHRSTACQPSLPPPAPAPSPVTPRSSHGTTSSSSAYTNALIKHSQRLRDRSMSPTAARTAIPVEQPKCYKKNQDYYRGKVKSVYEKEPMFKDFVRNIPLSEMNFDDSRNLTNLKQRFNTMVQIKHGTDLNNKYDPYIPSGRPSCSYEPRSNHLNIKHSSIPKPPPSPSVPRLYIYHRASRII